MDSYCNEIGHKMRSAVKAKLLELGTGGSAGYIDDELPDYVMIMVANKRSKQQMITDLNLFLGEQTELFVTWLHEVLQKLQEVTVSTSSLTRKRKLTHKEELSASLSSKREKKLNKQKEKTTRRISKEITVIEVESNSANLQQPVTAVSLTDMFAVELLERAKHDPELNTDLQLNIKESKMKGKCYQQQKSEEDRDGTQITTKSTINEFDIPTISEISSTEINLDSGSHHQEDELSLENIVSNVRINSDNGMAATDGLEKDLAELAAIQKKIYAAKKQLREMGELDDDDDLLNIRDDDCREVFNEEDLELNTDKPEVSMTPPIQLDETVDILQQKVETVLEPQVEIRTSSPSTTRSSVKRKSPIIFDRHSDEETTKETVKNNEEVNENWNHKQDFNGSSKRRRFVSPPLSSSLTQKIISAATVATSLPVNPTTLHRPSQEKRPVHERLGLKISKDPQNVNKSENNDRYHKKEPNKAIQSSDAMSSTSVSLASSQRYKNTERDKQRSPIYRREQHDSRQQNDRHQQDRRYQSDFRSQENRSKPLYRQEDYRYQQESLQQNYGHQDSLSRTLKDGKSSSRERGRERERRINRSRDRDRNNSRLFPSKSRSLEKRSSSQVSIENTKNNHQDFSIKSVFGNNSTNTNRRMVNPNNDKNDKTLTSERKQMIVRNNSLDVSISSETSSNINNKTHDKDKERKTEANSKLSKSSLITQRRRIGSRIIVAPSSTTMPFSTTELSPSTNKNLKYVGSIVITENDNHSHRGQNSNQKQHPPVNSIIKIRPRSPLSPSKQAPKNLLLKAVAEAQRSTIFAAAAAAAIDSKSREKKISSNVSQRLGERINPTTELYSKSYRERLKNSSSDKVNYETRTDVRSNLMAGTGITGHSGNSTSGSGSGTLFRRSTQNIMIDMNDSTISGNGAVKKSSRNLRNDVQRHDHAEEKLDYVTQNMATKKASNKNDIDEWDRDYIYMPQYAHLQSFLAENEENDIGKDIHRQRIQKELSNSKGILKDFQGQPFSRSDNVEKVLINAEVMHRDEILGDVDMRRRRHQDSDEHNRSPGRKTQFVVTLNDDKTLPKLQHKDRFSHSESPQPNKSFSSNLSSSIIGENELLSSKVIREHTPVSTQILKISGNVNRTIEKSSTKPSIKERLSEKVVTTSLSSLSSNRKGIQSNKTSISRQRTKEKEDHLTSGHRKDSSGIVNKDQVEKKRKSCSEKEMEPTMKDKKCDNTKKIAIMSGNSANMDFNSNTNIISQNKRKHTPITFDLNDHESSNIKKIRADNTPELSFPNKTQKKHLLSSSNDVRKVLTKGSSSAGERHSSEEEEKQEQKRKIYIRNTGEIKKYDDVPSSLNVVSTKDGGSVNSVYSRNTKSKERCKYHPNCTKAFCDYYHSTSICKSFPNCKFTDNCKYSHPRCKYDLVCTNVDCNYSHSGPRNLRSYESAAPPLSSHVVPVQNYKSISASSVSANLISADSTTTGGLSGSVASGSVIGIGAGLQMGLSMGTTICKYYPNCNKSTCLFYHPKLCRYGKNCINKADCIFYHHELSPSSKFKWVASVH